MLMVFMIKRHRNHSEKCLLLWIQTSILYYSQNATVSPMPFLSYDNNSLKTMVCQKNRSGYFIYTRRKICFAVTETLTSILTSNFKTRFKNMNNNNRMIPKNKLHHPTVYLTK